MDQETPVPVESAEAPSQKIIKLAVVYAIIFDLCISVLLGMISGYIYIAFISGGTFIYFADYQKEITTNVGFTAIFFIFGSFVSLMSGYLVAQLGKYRPYAHAMWAAGILVLFHFISNLALMTRMITKTSEVSTLDIFSIISMPFVFVVYLMGAHIYKLVHNDKP